MMRRCDICGKGSQHGNRVSKTYHHTRHVWLPNLHKVKADFGDGGARRINVCTQCLRSGFVVKKVHVPKEARN
ncbi:MAG: 50S ribosomal protein L28 [Treponemataceae bacterium]|nr:50S ribosomal protein L28 [Treponema sp.]MBD5434730.1 50S ribosomal protein L28 [Treponema sp.]MBD5438531.1 50S ribosomal protein L28 [Treponema sp.]MDE5580803.1 50S ribosomal protein L28 [Treponemataceae bacterium]MDE6067626.1 50S ribosomal protein L28 [Treponemataceae bacterium]